MLPGITPALFGARAASPGNDSFTKLLAHFEGANNYNWFFDSSLAAHGYATVTGAATVQNGSPLGASGNGVLSQSNSYLTWPNSADWEFGAGDFTVDWWEYRSAAGGAAICRDVTTVYCPFLLNWTNAGEIYMTSTGSSWDIANGAGGLPNPGFGQLLTTWTHLAVTRQGNTFRAFRDGVLKSTWTSSLALKSNTNPLSIGVGQTSNYFVGYMEEVRISKGIARWTANFTPPSKAYGPDSLPPPATKFSVSAPGSATSGTAFNVTVTALDANNNRVPTYTGTVHLTSTNGTATLPGNSTLTNGQGVFSVTLKTGTWTVTATDTVNGSITGTSAAIAVAAPAAKAVALGSSQTWTVPADWNSANNYIYCIGGGGGGGSGTNYPTGGGGGGYAIRHNIALTPNSGAGVAVGGGGGPDGAGGTTSFAGIVVATGGGAGGSYGNPPGAGGGASAGDGGYAGGAGGNSGQAGTAGGGGGAAGTYGAGGAGGAGSAVTQGNGGGGGCGGGTAGQPGNDSTGGGGNGGSSPWAAGGAGGAFAPGGAGTSGSGGGGGSGAPGTGGNGGNGPDYSGGGGGAGSTSPTGNGGYYGGGGAGRGGYGAQGVIFIWWQPA
jgi:hypothetical protein